MERGNSDETIRRKSHTGFGPLPDLYPHRARGNRLEGKVPARDVRPEVPALPFGAGCGCGRTDTGSCLEHKTSTPSTPSTPKHAGRGVVSWPQFCHSGESLDTDETEAAAQTRDRCSGGNTGTGQAFDFARPPDPGHEVLRLWRRNHSGLQRTALLGLPPLKDQRLA